jgi:hypothetical protein
MLLLWIGKTCPHFAFGKASSPESPLSHPRQTPTLVNRCPQSGVFLLENAAKWGCLGVLRVLFGYSMVTKSDRSDRNVVFAENPHVGHIEKVRGKTAISVTSVTFRRV